MMTLLAISVTWNLAKERKRTHGKRKEKAKITTHFEINAICKFQTRYTGSDMVIISMTIPMTLIASHRIY